MIRICNWEKFQHYSDRCPPWIKLHKKLLDNRQWHELGDGPARVLVELWLLASESDPGGEVGLSLDDLTWRLRRKNASTMLAALEVLRDKGFIEFASTLLADATQRRGETETETEKKCAFEVEFSTFWEQYPKRVGKQTALKAWQARRREGISVEDIMAGLTRYLKYKAITGEKHLNASTFLGPDERWAEDWYVAEVKTVVEDKRPVLDEKFKRPYEPVIESRPTRVEIPFPHRGAV